MALYRENVGAFLYDPALDQVLLHLRDNKTTFYPLFWAPFGGGIEKGESPIDALTRELFEEIRLKLDRRHLLYLGTHALEIGPASLYAVLYLKDSQKLSLHEGKDMRWFTLEEARTLKLTSHLDHILQKFQSGLSAGVKIHYAHLVNT